MHPPAAPKTPLERRGAELPHPQLDPPPPIGFTGPLFARDRYPDIKKVNQTLTNGNFIFFNFSQFLIYDLVFCPIKILALLLEILVKKTVWVNIEVRTRNL